MASDEVGGVADEHLLDDDVVAETGEYVWNCNTKLLELYQVPDPILVLSKY